MLNKLFRPKWQHRKAQVRLAALHELAASDPVLLEVAREDREPMVRQQAVRLSGDLQGLSQLFADASDQTVREVAGKRLKRLLTGQELSLSLEQRLNHIGRCCDEEITAYVLQHAVETELRSAALAAVSRPSLLAEVALNDPCAELRLAAVERIERPGTLERLVREARGKDKRVSRRAREKLEAERTAQLRPQRQAEICQAVEALVQQGGVDLVSLRRLQDEWNALLPLADPAVGERYQDACAAFDVARARIQSEAASAARQRELCERCECMLRELEAPEADLQGLDGAINRLRSEWTSLEEQLPDPNSGLRERFNDALSQACRRHADRLREGEEVTRLHALLDRLAGMVEVESAPSADALQRLEGEWMAAGGDSKQPHTAALGERFASLAQRAKESLAERGKRVRALQREYGTLLGQMEAALSDGQVQQATACRDRLADREKKLAALGCRASITQQRRRKLAYARLQELRDWRRFGTHNAREELLATLTALQAEPLEPPKQAEAVKAAREAWRKLDCKDGIAPDALRQAFEEAADTAYAPCREYYEEQESQRKENLALRRRFIAELEQDYDAVDWEQPDWAALEQRLQQAQKRWPTLGGVPRAEWQELNAGFKRALAAFEQRLSARRESEKSRREALIRQVEALAGEPDLEKALAETRKAQAGWRPDVCCPQRVEQALWRSFKRACDEVYARRKAMVDAQLRDEREQQTRLQRLCEQAEGLVAEAGRLPEQALNNMVELQRQWRDIDGQGARRNKALLQRFDAAAAALRQAEEKARRRQAVAGRELLLHKASLCLELERQLFGPMAAEEGTRLEGAWQALEALPDVRFDELLSARFGCALEQLRSGDTAGLDAEAQENLERCRMLCLQLEILARVDSPQAFAEERLAMQVQLLADAMTGQMSEAQRQARIDALLAAYFTLGPLPPTEADGMHQRIEAVLAASN